MLVVAFNKKNSDRMFLFLFLPELVEFIRVSGMDPTSKNSSLYAVQKAHKI